MKPKFLLSVVLALLLTYPVLAQKETRKVPSFTKISFGISADLYLRQGDIQKVELEGDKEDLEKVEIEVVNGDLKIRMKNSGWYNDTDDITIYITVPELEEISLSGSGKVIGETKIKSESLELSVSGSGRMEIDIDVNSLEQSISGSGSITLKGNSGDVELSISGSGKLDAVDLQAKNYDVTISGSGKASISVSGDLRAQISGSGSVYYKGEPARINANTSGSGRVKKLE